MRVDKDNNERKPDAQAKGIPEPQQAAAARLNSEIRLRVRLVAFFKTLHGPSLEAEIMTPALAVGGALAIRRPD